MVFPLSLIFAVFRYSLLKLFLPLWLRWMGLVLLLKALGEKKQPILIQFHPYFIVVTAESLEADSSKLQQTYPKTLCMALGVWVKWTIKDRMLSITSKLKRQSLENNQSGWLLPAIIKCMTHIWASASKQPKDGPCHGCPRERGSNATLSFCLFDTLCLTVTAVILRVWQLTQKWGEGKQRVC